VLSIEVLGRFRLVVDDEPVELRGAQRSRVAALLSAHAPDPVSMSVLVECLDPEARSSNPANAVQAHIRRLRTAIEPGVPGSRSTRLPAIGDGYALVPDRMDLWDLRAAVDDARARRDVDPAGAARRLASVLDRWGTPWGSLGEEQVLDDQRWALAAERLGLEDEWCAPAPSWRRASVWSSSPDRSRPESAARPTRCRRCSNSDDRPRRSGCSTWCGSSSGTHWGSTPGHSSRTCTSGCCATTRRCVSVACRSAVCHHGSGSTPSWAATN